MKYIFTVLTLSFLAVSCLRVPSPEIPVIQPQNVNTSAPAQTSYIIPLQVGSQTIFVEIAKTPQAQAQGLSGRDGLTDTQGMLFDFSNSQTGRPGFWMKQMKFNLDFIWIKNNKIVSITKNAAHPNDSNEKLILYYPPSSVDFVLEVNAGWSDLHNILVGDAVALQN